MTPEERLLRAIFTKSEHGEQDELDEMPGNYPATYLEKADYAMHCIHKSLESISPALGRISRLHGLLQAGQEGEKNTLPRIITHNESRMALKHLARVKRDVDDAYQEILSIFENTKEPGAVAKMESVGQGPEPGKATTHIAERVNDLMYKGCEPHWRCVKCGECVPFHCYTKAQFEERACKGPEPGKEQA